VPNLLPGDYEVTATAPDFATKVETGITLNVGGHQQLNITLQVGTVTQTILVSSGNSSCSEVNLVIGRRSRSSAGTSKGIVMAPSNGAPAEPRMFGSSRMGMVPCFIWSGVLRREISVKYLDVL
jgi:hypothetical protein